MVAHGFFDVNGKKVDIPSFLVSVGDTVVIRPVKGQKAVWNTLEERLKKHKAPSWLFLDPAARTGKVTSLPMGNDLEQVFDPTLIVEFYSR